MKKSEAVDYILKDEGCMDMVKKISPLDLLKTLASLGLIKDKQEARDIILKVNEEVWMEPVKVHQWAPPPHELPGEWPYTDSNVEFMKRKNTAKQGFTK